MFNWLKVWLVPVEKELHDILSIFHDVHEDLEVYISNRELNVKENNAKITELIDDNAIHHANMNQARKILESVKNFIHVGN